MLGIFLQWTSIPFKEIRNTPCRFMLQKRDKPRRYGPLGSYADFTNLTKIPAWLSFFKLPAFGFQIEQEDFQPRIFVVFAKASIFNRSLFSNLSCFSYYATVSPVVFNSCAVLCKTGGGIQYTVRNRQQEAFSLLSRLCQKDEHQSWWIHCP